MQDDIIQVMIFSHFVADFWYFLSLVGFVKHINLLRVIWDGEIQKHVKTAKEVMSSAKRIASLFPTPKLDFIMIWKDWLR